MTEEQQQLQPREQQQQQQLQQGPKRIVAPWHDFVAGSIAGMAQVTVGQPLDVVRVRMQLDSTGTPKFRGAWHCFTYTVRNGGPLELFRGMASPLIGISAVNALLFAAYGRFKALLQQPGNEHAELSISRIALAGAGAGAINSVLASPVELLKIRRQAQYGAAASTVGPVEIARQLISRHGIRRGLFWGFNATVAREIPAYAAWYAAYETVKRQFAARLEPGQELPIWQLVVSGSTGGFFYWTCSYPLDVVKSQAQSWKEPPSSRSGVGYIGTTLSNIYKNGGAKALFRGYVPTVLRSLPAAGVTFAAYETVIKIIA
ncbi:mitochondrial carrier [Ramicandelaber brevisporus]|nr:mitochondrial carrier [Ramicandelaber brevisporus]